METKRKNWISFILAMVAAVVILLTGILTKNSLEVNINVEGITAEQVAQITGIVKNVYLALAIVSAVINALFGVWSLFKKGGCTALMVFAIVILVLGGVLLYLVPAILDFVANSKGKKAFEQFEREQKVLDEMAQAN